jgi:hypothetical protein
VGTVETTDGQNYEMQLSRVTADRVSESVTVVSAGTARLAHRGIAR